MGRRAWSDFDADLDLVTGRGLIPVFPADSFVPGRICPHMILGEDGKPTGKLRPMAARLKRICMGCHQTGFDGHPALKLDQLVDPKP